MTDFNPYAPPQVARVPQHVADARAAAKAQADANKGPDDFRVEGNEVTIRNNGQLPAICILTGAPASRQNWDMVWKSAFATLRGRLGVYLGAAASKRRDTARTLMVIAITIAGVALVAVSNLLETEQYGWVAVLTALPIHSCR